MKPSLDWGKGKITMISKQFKLSGDMGIGLERAKRKVTCLDGCFRKTIQQES